VFGCIENGYPYPMAAREYQLEIDAIDATLISIEKVLEAAQAGRRA
jgi:hypothetical protein